MKFLIVIFLLLSPFVSADHLYLGAWSYHFNDHPNKGWDESLPQEYNQTHNLIGYQKNGYMIGHYENSFNQSTVVVTRNFESNHKDFAFIFAVGATRGYNDCGNEKQNPGTDKKICGYYQAGIAYTKYRVQPVFGLSGSIAVLSFRIKI